MAIDSVLLHTNRNAPAGADGVYLYNTDLAQNLTLGQLMAAVCLRAGAILERQSVVKMNTMNRENASIERLSEILRGVAEETFSTDEWNDARAELLVQFGVVVADEPINTYDKRMAVMKSIKQSLDLRTQQSQEDMIDLQTCINRRDVALTTSTNMVRSLGQSAGNMASQLTR